MATVNGRPIIAYILDNLIDSGVKKVILSVGYKYGMIKSYVERIYNGRIDVRYAIERRPLGTGGAVRAALKGVAFKDAIVMFGDDITDIDFRQMYGFHLKKRAPITMAVVKVRKKDIKASGVVELNGDIVTNFVEKPDPDKVRSRLINGGIYIFRRGSLGLLPKRREFSLSTDFFEQVADKKVIYAYRSKHKWYPIDTPERYRKAKVRFEV